MLETSCFPLSIVYLNLLVFMRIIQIGIRISFIECAYHPVHLYSKLMQMHKQAAGSNEWTARSTRRNDENKGGKVKLEGEQQE